MRSRVLRAAAIAAGLLAGAARAQEDRPRWDLEVSVPVDYMDGHTTYEISASDPTQGSVRSKLEFPLQSVVVGLRGRAASPVRENGSRWILELGFSYGVPALARGSLKDSDWMDGQIEITEVGSAHPGKDIYSTSRAELTSLVVDGRIAWQHEVAPGFRLAPLVGYLYQNFSYDVYDAQQVGYGPWSAYSGSFGGKGLTYEVSWRAPYVGAHAQYTTGAVTLGGDAWYSPIASASDTDDHLLRYKRSTTEADGSAWQVRGEGLLAVGPRDTVFVRAAVIGFSATGTQTQRFYAGPDAGASGSIAAKLTSLRWSYGFGLTHGF